MSRKRGSSHTCGAVRYAQEFPLRSFETRHEQEALARLASLLHLKPQYRYAFMRQHNGEPAIGSCDGAYRNR